MVAPNLQMIPVWVNFHVPEASSPVLEHWVKGSFTIGCSPSWQSSLRRCQSHAAGDAAPAAAGVGRCGGGSCRSGVTPVCVCVSVSSCCHSAATRQTHIVLLDFTTTTTTAAAGDLLTRRRRGDSGSLSIFNAGDAVLPPALCIRPYFAGWKATSLILPDHSKSIKSLLETPQCE